MLFKSLGLTQKLRALSISACILLPIAATARADTTYTFIHLAGGTVSEGSADGTGSAARFWDPIATAIDSAGNIYVADSDNHTVRKITTAGVVTTFAGLAGVSGATDGTGSAARFVAPAGLAFDSTGNLFVSDAGDNTIRKITPAGVVTTFAGTHGTQGTADGTGTAALFTTPHGVACDSSDNLYVVDTGNDTIRKITPAGVVTTFAGDAGVSGSINATGTVATFNAPYGIAIDKSNTLYVTDNGNAEVRRIDQSTTVTIYAGVGVQGTLDGKVAVAEFYSPYGIAIDSSGNIFVTDAVADSIRKITTDGQVSTFAGNIYTAGSQDGAGNLATFNAPAGISIDKSNNIYLADAGNQVIRKIAADATVSTIAGSVPTLPANTDGTGSAARFNSPQGMVRDSAGNIFVADYANYTLRKITPAGVVTTFAGTAGTRGYADGTGTAATFGGLDGLTIDSADNIYATDNYDSTIRKITPAGVVTTIAGSPLFPGGLDGTGHFAYFDLPAGITIDPAGNLYVADFGNDTIRKITPAGIVSTIAGTRGITGTTDGPGSVALFSAPNGITIDTAGNLFVTDSDNSTIRKITPSGVVSTIAGKAGKAGTVDGIGTAAEFSYPQGITMDSSGNLFVADSTSNAIRKIAPDGTVTTLSGTTPENIDGVGSAAKFNFPTGIIVNNATGNLYISDQNNNDIRLGISGASGTNTITIKTQPVSQSVFSGLGGVFTVSATSQFALTYQWQTLAPGTSTWTNISDGGNFSGTATASLSVVNVTTSMNGEQFRVVISDGSQVASTSTAVTLSVADSGTGTPDGTARLSNISTRSSVGSAANVQIAGFIISGTATKTVLIRANGPALQKSGIISGFLADPKLVLHNTDSTQSVITTNDNWGDSATEKANVLAAVRAAGATAWDDGSKDAAIVATLSPGGYTAVVSSADGTSTGISLVEIFVVDQSNSASKLTNISTRSLVGTGANVQIAGFIVSGSSPKRVVIRANGPALSKYGITSPLADPQIELHSNATGQPIIGTNDNWDAASQEPTFKTLGIDNWDVGSKDAAIITTLPPGGYTAIVSGVGGTTGVALVEVYDAD